MNDQKTSRVLPESRLNARLAAYAIRAVRYVLDPLILRCFGWEHKTTYYDRTNWELWRDPKTGSWWTQSSAIQICENRIKGG